MANIKDPSGSFYLDSSEFNVDYVKNKISLVDGGGGGSTVGVSSFNGRTGAVNPQEGDYTAEQVGALALTGGTLTGALVLNAEPTANMQASTKQYVDTQIQNLTQTVNTMGETINDILDGTEPLHYMDEEQADAKYLQLSGGTMTGNITMPVDGVISGTDELQISVADNSESATVGVTPEGVTIVHNTNSAPNASVRVIENTIQLEANGATVSFDTTGVNFGGGVITNVASIGGNSDNIAFENPMDMNNHNIINVTDPVNAQDAMTKNYGDTTYATKSEIAGFITNDDLPVAATTSIAGIVKQATAVADSSGATDTTLEAKVNELLAALRTAGILAPNA